MTISNKKTAQEIKVLAINTLYEYAKKIFLTEHEYFNSFLGVNIFKVDGSFKAKYQRDSIRYKGQLPDGTWFDVSYWFEYKYNELRVTIKLCVNGGTYEDNTYFCHYESLNLTLFETDKEGKLIPTNTSIEFLDTRYDLNELTKIADNIKAKAIEYENEVNKMNWLFKDAFGVKRLSS